MSSFRIMHYDRVDSTNIRASALLSENKIDCNTVVAAKFQTNGRGQGLNSWLSEYGKNILVSLVVCPHFLKAPDQFNLSKITSLALVYTLKQLSINCEIKWPNDILVKKRKIAGILIENILLADKITSSVIGIGLNVNQEVFENMTVMATSVSLESSENHDTGILLGSLLDNFEFWYSKLEMNETDDIDKEYLKYLYGLNTFMLFRKGKVAFEGMITGVGEAGELFLRRKDGKILKFYFREIEYL